MALVLCTGVDPVLLKTRQLILEKAGHTVVACTDEPCIMRACRQYAFDVAVVGHRMQPKLKRRFVSFLHEYSPSARILELYVASTGKQLEDADAWLEVPVDIAQEFADRVTELAAQKTKS